MLKNADVLIIGAGPTGLMMAHCLLKQNISFAIIDKKGGPTLTSNAIGVNARTLEVWQSYGFVDKAIGQGLKLNGVAAYASGKELNYNSLAEIHSAYKFMLSLPQAQTEQLLLEELERQGVQVAWQTELTELQPQNDTVTVQCNAPSGEVSASAKWVIGCDGYHSKVREFAGIERKCHDLPLHFLMVDAQLKSDLKPASINLFAHRNGFIFIIPMRENIRIAAEISADPVYKDVKTCEAETFKAIVKSRYPHLYIEEVDWTSAFYIHECLADHYRKDRVFLAGDAAHTHSPLGGQGLNTGIQDAWNLGWKLGQVMRGEASESLLETYHLERHAVAKEVLKRTGLMTSMATTKSALFEAVRNFFMKHVQQLSLVKSKMNNTICQTDICYENSPLIHNAHQIKKYKALKYPEFQGAWTLLTRTQTDTCSLPKFISEVKDEGNRIPSTHNFCLIRPDGYIAMYANSIEEIQKFFKQNHFTV